MDKLRDFKRQKTNNKTAEFEAWDMAYYMGRYDEEVLKFDESEMSDYFPSERVVQ